MQKPYRFLVGRVASYAEEGSAYLRRRKMRGRPFARIWSEGGTVVAAGSGSASETALFDAASTLIALAGTAATATDSDA